MRQDRRLRTTALPAATRPVSFLQTSPYRGAGLRMARCACVGVVPWALTTDRFFYTNTPATQGVSLRMTRWQLYVR